MSDQEFVTSVLSRFPRVAAFDCDGTLWASDAGEGFFYWSIEQGLVVGEAAKRALRRYEVYRAGKVSEKSICGEMVSLYQGRKDSAMARSGRDYFRRFIVPCIYPAMAELVSALSSQGGALWLISSTNRWVIEAAAEWLRIPVSRVIAATPVLASGRVTDRLLCVPTGEAKASCFLRRARSGPDAAFGNSMHDAALLRLARCPFAINPDPELRQLAAEAGWQTHVLTPGVAACSGRGLVWQRKIRRVWSQPRDR